MDVSTTTTDEPILPDETGAEALPVEASEQPAATTAEPTQTEAEGDAESVPEADDKLASFAKGQGIDSMEGLSDREKRLLKVAYDNNAEFQRNRQRATELEKTLSAPQPTDDDTVVNALASEVQNLKMAQSVQNFWTDNPEAREFEGKMTELVTSRPEIGQMVKYGHLSIGDLYSLAQGSDPAALKAAGGKEALEKVAKKQQAKAIPGSATTSEFSQAEKEDAFSKGFDAA